MLFPEGCSVGVRLQHALLCSGVLSEGSCSWQFVQLCEVQFESPDSLAEAANTVSVQSKASVSDSLSEPADDASVQKPYPPTVMCPTAPSSTALSLYISSASAPPSLLQKQQEALASPMQPALRFALPHSFSFQHLRLSMVPKQCKSRPTTASACTAVFLYDASHPPERTAALPDLQLATVTVDTTHIVTDIADLVSAQSAGEATEMESLASPMTAVPLQRDASAGADVQQLGADPTLAQLQAQVTALQEQLTALQRSFDMSVTENMKWKAQFELLVAAQP